MIEPALPLELLIPPSLGAIAATARADLLADWLGRRWMRPVSVRVAKDYEELEAEVLARAVDLAWAPPTLCARVAHLVPAVFTAVRNGSATFRSALVVRPRDIERLSDLHGKIAGWVDPRSSGGYLLAMAHLRKKGIDPDRFFAEQRFLGSYGDAMRALVNRAIHVAPVFVHGEDARLAQAVIAELAGTRAAATLGILDITDPTPGDGLLVVRRPDEGGIDITAVEAVVDGSHTNLLLSIFEAERLERASPAAYAALR